MKVRSLPLPRNGNLSKREESGRLPARGSILEGGEEDEKEDFLIINNMDCIYHEYCYGGGEERRGADP